MLLRDVARVVRSHLLDAPYEFEFPRTGRARWGHTLRVTTWALRLAVEVGERGEAPDPALPPDHAWPPDLALPPDPRASLDRAHKLLADLMDQPIGPLDLPSSRHGAPAIDVGALATAGIIHDVAKYDIRPEDAGLVRHAPRSADFARELLGRAGDLPRAFVDTVEALVRFHSVDTDAQSDEVLRTFGGRVPVELLLIKDADGLDELGAQFIILDAMHLGAEPDPYPAYLVRSAKYLPRLFSQDDRFQTEPARRYYRRLTGVVRTFVDSLKEELAGQLWEDELLGESR